MWRGSPEARRSVDHDAGNRRDGMQETVETVWEATWDGVLRGPDPFAHVGRPWSKPGMRFNLGRWRDRRAWANAFLQHGAGCLTRCKKSPTSKPRSMRWRAPRSAAER